MEYLDIISKRRSYYELGSEVDIEREKIVEIVSEVILKTPSAGNMQDGFILLLFDEHSRKFWEKVDDTFDNKLDPKKLEGFKNAKGTALFFSDRRVTEANAKKFEAYKDRFEDWIHHGNAMLQVNLWNALREKNIGASLQHYNPAIDTWVKEDYELDDELMLIAQMPFGKILNEPKDKKKRDIIERLKII